MINYVNHDQQFFGIIKLSSGEEILGEMVATEDVETPGTTIVFITNPARTKQVQVEQEGKMGVGVGLIKWQYFSDEDFYIISEKDIISIAPMSREGTLVYKRWLKNELDEDDSDDSHKTDIPKHLGGRGSVKEARSILEKLFKAPSSDKS
jgi:hypothetical protein